MVTPNNSCSIVGLFKGQVYTIKSDILSILTPPALYSFPLSLLNDSAELEVLLTTPSSGPTGLHALLQLA